MSKRPNLPDFDTEAEATAAGQRLIDEFVEQYPHLKNKMQFEVGIHPMTEKYTLKLLLQRNGCYPLEIDGLYGTEGHSVVVLRILPDKF